MIVQLWVEYEAAIGEISGSEAHELLRQEVGRETVDNIEAWVDARKEETPPKSPLGNALTYATNQRKTMRVFLSDP